MERIVAFSRATGGYFCEDDFRNYHPEWVEPITQDYRGYTVARSRRMATALRCSWRSAS